MLLLYLIKTVAGVGKLYTSIPVLARRHRIRVYKACGNGNKDFRLVGILHSDKIISYQNTSVFGSDLHTKSKSHRIAVDIAENDMSFVVIFSSLLSRLTVGRAACRDRKHTFARFGFVHRHFCIKAKVEAYISRFLTAILYREAFFTVGHEVFFGVFCTVYRIFRKGFALFEIESSFVIGVFLFLRFKSNSSHRQILLRIVAVEALLQKLLRFGYLAL